MLAGAASLGLTGLWQNSACTVLQQPALPCNWWLSCDAWHCFVHFFSKLHTQVWQELQWGSQMHSLQRVVLFCAGEVPKCHTAVFSAGAKLSSDPTWPSWGCVQPVLPMGEGQQRHSLFLEVLFLDLDALWPRALSSPHDNSDGGGKKKKCLARGACPLGCRAAFLPQLGEGGGQGEGQGPCWQGNKVSSSCSPF